MALTRSHIRVAVSSGGTETAPGREFLQDRLRLFGLWNAILSGGFLLLRLLSERFLGAVSSWRAAVVAPGVGVHALAVLAAGVAWYVTRPARALSTRALLSIDAVLVVLLGILYAVMGAQVAVDPTSILIEPMAAMLTASLALHSRWCGTPWPCPRPRSAVRRSSPRPWRHSSSLISECWEGRRTTRSTRPLRSSARDGPC